MLNNVWFVATVWMALAFIASLISIRLGISVALVEIFVGVLAGNFLGIHQTTQWIDFLAMLGSGVLTFLAGAEIDPESLKSNLKASLTLGSLAFLLPFGFIWLFAQFVLGWSIHQAQIAGIALSTALFGLNNHIINQKQYTILVTVVILSAVIPTLIAQKFFQPSEEAMNAWGRLFNGKNHDRDSTD